MSVASASELAENSVTESQQQSGINSTLTSPEQTTPTANSDASEYNEQDNDKDSDDRHTDTERPQKRQKTDIESDPSIGTGTGTGTGGGIASGSEAMYAQWEQTGSAEHNGQIYYIGDHAILEDIDNSSGTEGTELSPVGQILDIQREAHSGSVNLTVSWYVYPQKTSHPPYMEFYKNAVLRTFRQTVVPLERLRELCYVVQPADSMVGRPGEWVEGKMIFVCESRYVDKGDFIQKIKHWNRGIWPEAMDQKRREMLTTMVPWPDGPRELEKSLVPVEITNDSAGNTPQTRRVTRMTSAPNSDAATPQNANAAVLQQQQQQLMQTPTPVSAQAQLLAYQQMLSQGRMNMPMAMNGQMAPPPPFILNQLQQQQQQLQMQLLQQQQHQQRMQQQQQHQAQQQIQPVASTPILSAGSISSPAHDALPLTSPTSSVIQPPRRRGRPPKNKQLIEQRAMEDAAAVAAIAQGRTPAKPAPAVTRRQSSSAASPYGNSGRPAFQQPKTNMATTAGYGAMNGSGGPQAMNGQPTYTPAQLLGTRSQGGVAAAQALQQQQLQQLHHQQQQLQQLQQKQQQQANVTKIAPLPHIDPSTVAQLSEEVVDLFPTSDGKIKWYATAPVCRSLTKAAQHSEAYLSWLKQKKDKQLAAQRHSDDGCLDPPPSTAAV